MDILKDLQRDICRCKDNYNQHRRLFRSRQNVDDELKEYRKELETLRKKYHYDEKQKKIADLCLKINENEVERYKQYLICILKGYKYCIESGIDESAYSNFLLDNGIYVCVHNGEVDDCILDVKSAGVGDFDIVDHFVMGYACDNECQIPLEIIDDNEFIGKLYNTLKGLV